MYHYTSCGLTNIWLHNGFTEKETPYGQVVSIHNIEGLHKTIGLHIINNIPILKSEHLRFLRKEIDFTQNDLAGIIGVSDSTLRNWENDRVEPTEAAVLILRQLYSEYVDKESYIRELANRVSQLNREIHDCKVCFEETNKVWKEAA